MDDEEMPINPELYKLVCKKRFDDAATERAEILRVLRGANSQPGLVDDVRALKRTYKALIGAVIFVMSALFLQGLDYIIDRFFQ